MFGKLEVTSANHSQHRNSRRKGGYRAGGLVAVVSLGDNSHSTTCFTYSRMAAQVHQFSHARNTTKPRQ